MAGSGADEAWASDDQPRPGGNGEADAFGLLDVDDPEEVGAIAKSKPSPALSLSPFLMADEDEDPEAPADFAEDASWPEAEVAQDAQDATHEPDDTDEPDDGFPSFADVPPAPESEEREPWPAAFGPVASGDAQPQVIPSPALHEAAALPDALPATFDAFLVPTARAEPIAEPVPADDDTAFDFDPIAIFLQGRESETAPPEGRDPEPPVEINDEPALDNLGPESDSLAVQGYDDGSAPVRQPESWMPPTSDPVFPAEDTDLINLFAPAVHHPRPTIPKARGAGRRGAPPAGKLAPRSVFQAPHLAEGTAPTRTAPLFSSPFLLAPAAQPGAAPEPQADLFPVKRAAKPARKAHAFPFILVGCLAATAGGAALLYLNPGWNPFATAKSTEIRQPTPLPITPVKPDGSTPTLRPNDGAPAPEPSPSAAPAPEVREVDIPQPPAASPDPLPLTDEDFAAIVKDPERTLATFLAAGSNAERLRVSHLPDGIRERMDAHASAHGEGPIAYNAIVPKLSSTVPGTTVPTHLFLVTTPTQPDGFPVSVEDTESGFRVDWDAFVQFNDKLLEAFLTDPSSPPAPFFVVLRRSHYFGEDVPDPNHKLCYRIMSPISADIEHFAFVDTTSPVGEEAAKSLTWGRSYRPVVRLEWSRAADAAPYIAITEVVRSTWRGTGSDASPEG